MRVTPWFAKLRSISVFSGPSVETKGVVFSCPLKEHTLDVRGEEWTVEAHSYEKEEGRVVFYRYLYPVVTSVGSEVYVDE